MKKVSEILPSALSSAGKVFAYSDVRRPPQVRVYCPPEEGRTSQADAADCDINVICSRIQSGQYVPLPPPPPSFVDESDGKVSFREALDYTRRVQAFFDRLPAEVRGEFGNDAGAFVEAMGSAEAVAALVERGVLSAEGAPVETPASKAAPAA